MENKCQKQLPLLLMSCGLALGLMLIGCAVPGAEPSVAAPAERVENTTVQTTGASNFTSLRGVTFVAGTGLKNVNWNVFVSAKKDGQLLPDASVFGETETFNVAFTSDFKSFALWSRVRQKWVSADRFPDGWNHLYANKDSAGAHELFRTVYQRTVGNTNQYAITAWDGELVFCCTDKIITANGGNLFEFVHGGYPEATVALRSYINGNYVCADAGVQLTPLYSGKTAKEKSTSFALIDLGNNLVALRAYTNARYVCAEYSATHRLTANRDAIGPWETFYLLVLSNNRVAFRSEVNKKYVRYDSFVPEQELPGPGVWFYVEGLEWIQ